MIELELLCITFCAGLGISIGAALAYRERIQNSVLVQRIKPFSVALGGGLLLSAVSLVLIPEALKNTNFPHLVISFLSGGFFFYYLDKKFQKNGGELAQFMATLLDFIPESVALGASYLHSPRLAIFLGVIIFLQNVPEGFNAFSDMVGKDLKNSKKYLYLFIGVALLGPFSAGIGYYFLASREFYLSFLMLFSSSGIIYLLFQDIAPESKIDGQWTPALGAVIGFFLGIIGKFLVGQ